LSLRHQSARCNRSRADSLRDLHHRLRKSPWFATRMVLLRQSTYGVVDTMSRNVRRALRTAVYRLSQRGNYGHCVAIRRWWLGHVALGGGVLLSGLGLLGLTLLHAGIGDTQLAQSLIAYVASAAVVLCAVRPDAPARILGQIATAYWHLIGGDQKPTSRLAPSMTEHALSRVRANHLSIRAVVAAMHAAFRAVAVLVARLHSAHVCTCMRTLPAPRFAARA
jgi:hypothetical protein